MKRYATTYSNGHTEETSSAHEALSFVNYDDAQTWFLRGKQVSAEAFFSDVRNACEAYLTKKMETHKQIRVRHGASVLSFKTVWVRK